MRGRASGYDRCRPVLGLPRLTVILDQPNQRPLMRLELSGESPDDVLNNARDVVVIVVMRQ